MVLRVLRYSDQVILSSLNLVVNGSTSCVVPLALVVVLASCCIRCSWCDAVLRPGFFHELMLEFSVKCCGVSDSHELMLLAI